ncbi:hypothetical protein ACFL5K_02755 [Gemmatimonadota bacterium]
MQKPENGRDDGEFMQYCDSIVERALEAADTIFKNRARKNKRR